MKIVYLHQYFNTPDMAGGTRSYEMARRLVAKGHEVRMVTADCVGRFPGNVNWHITDEAGIEVHWVSVPYSNHMGYTRRIGAFLKFARLSARKASSLPGDIVFATSTPLTIALPAAYAARKKGVPMVFEVRDLWPDVPIALGALKNPAAVAAARRLEQFAYRRSAHIVALSERMKESVVDKGYLAEKVTVIPNGCDLDLFDADPRPGIKLRERHRWLRHRPLVIYTGAIGLVNGIDYFVKIAAAVLGHSSEARFLVIGTGKEEEKVRQLAKQLGVFERNFFMIPPLPKREVVGWLSAATLATSFVRDMEILRADSANKFFDALAAGKPVAVNYGGWQAEIIRENGVGLVMDPRDEKKAAARLLDVLGDKIWLSLAGEAALKLARERFSRDLLAGELERVLSSAAGNQ